MTAPPGVARATERSRGQDTGVDGLRAALFVFIVVSVSVIQTHFGVLRALRLGLVSFALACVALLLSPHRARWRNLTSTWPPRAVFWIVVVACFSVPFGISLGQSANYLLTIYSRNLLFFFIMVVAIRSVWDVRWFTWAFVISAAVLSVLSFTVMEMTVTYGGMMRLDSTQMYDANDLGLIFVVAIPLALLLMQTSTLLPRILAIASLASITLAIALTGSRGAFVGLVVITPALFFTMRHVGLGKRLTMVVALAAGLALAAPEGYWDQIASIVDTEDNYNYTAEAGRVEIAKRGLGYMWRYPFFGVGISNFSRAEGTISPMARNSFYENAVPWLAPHNTYVQVGAELGVSGLALWLSILWLGTIGLYRMRRLWGPEGSRLDPRSDAGFLFHASTYMPIAFLGFAATSFFISHAYTPILYILAAILAGVIDHYRTSLPAAAKIPPGAPAAARWMAPSSRSASRSQ